MATTFLSPASPEDLATPNHDVDVPPGSSLGEHSHSPPTDALPPSPHAAAQPTTAAPDDDATPSSTPAGAETAPAATPQTAASRLARACEQLESAHQALSKAETQETTLLTKLHELRTGPERLERLGSIAKKLREGTMSVKLQMAKIVEDEVAKRAEIEGSIEKELKPMEEEVGW